MGDTGIKSEHQTVLCGSTRLPNTNGCGIILNINVEDDREGRGEMIVYLCALI
tara:strand:+ start:455 stop:613 length:159 start_codon:yes stop_codon:yes gene_type:complete